MLQQQLEPILPRVQKPARYTGGELNSVLKDKGAVDIRFAFCFPDTYEIGMSHLGMKILYSLINERPDSWCERVFAPWTDMEKEMRSRGVELYALESGDSLRGFDIIGFTLQYELSYTNVLNMLDLAGLPLRAAERNALAPLVIGGGPCVCNPEPLAEYFDMFLPGEGEEVVGELLDLYKKHKAAGSSKAVFLQAAAGIKGVYVPSLYEVVYNTGGTVRAVLPRPGSGAPEKVRKRLVRNLDRAFVPTSYVVPSVETVHDRVSVEVFRGCVRGCRFCQAGYIYRPVREKSPETVNAQCLAGCESTGYDEVSLCSLSTGDYTRIEPLAASLLEWTNAKRVNLSLPSLRVDSFSRELSEKLTSVRRSGLTFAPEAGTQRLRDIINKNITEQEILSAAAEAFAAGWVSVKLYFMLGLPGETPEDIEGIAALAQKIVDLYYANPSRPKGKSVTVSVSVATFVPKPFTAFQWEAQNTAAEIAEKQSYLKSLVKSRKIRLSFHNREMSALEAVFALGDRRLAAVIETAWKSGCRFDGWDDVFQPALWQAAFASCGLDPSFYANRRKGFEEFLPWEVLDYGVSRAFLERENARARRAETTPSCREKCAGCGANALNGGSCDAND